MGIFLVFICVFIKKINYLNQIKLENLNLMREKRKKEKRKKKNIIRKFIKKIFMKAFFSGNRNNELR